MKLSAEERAKIRLGYFWDIVPEEAREKARREILAADEGKAKHGAGKDACNG